MESYKTPDNSLDDDSNVLSDLATSLSEITKNPVLIEYLEKTHEIDTDDFTLSFTLTDDRFEIRNIDVHGNTGLGHKIIESIHDFADKNNLDVTASNVVDTANGFWENMGYQEGSEEGEFFRII